MNKRIVVTFLATLFLVSVHFAEAQQLKRIPQIGFLSWQSASLIPDSMNAFRQGLGDLGYIEGKNIAIEYRWAEGRIERLPELAAELVRLRVDVIVAAGGTPAIQAAKNVTSAIPIVFTGLGTDPVEIGFVASLARPGGNITGVEPQPEPWGCRFKPLRYVRPTTSMRHSKRQREHKPGV